MEPFAFTYSFFTLTIVHKESKNFVAFHDAAIKAVSTGDITFAKIRESAGDIMYKLSQMKFEVCLWTHSKVAATDVCTPAVADTRQGRDQDEDGRAVQ